MELRWKRKLKKESDKEGEGEKVIRQKAGAKNASAFCL
ncbi:hypothetical protein DSBG_2213 [Desulfosporosinus sp. BG]|nr:hypothetical protein DSBG_2213 [Desulfosporosinus sp. BG]